MELITQTEASKRLEVNQSYIAKLIRQGKIKRYGSKVDFDEITTFREDRIDDPSREPQKNWNKKQKKEPIEKKIKKASIDNSSKEKSNKPTYAEAKTHREAFMAKIAELNYKEKAGLLISIDDAKAIIEAIYSPMSKKLDDVHVNLKAHHPDVSLEAIDWLSNHINDIKKSIKETRWQQ